MSVDHPWVHRARTLAHAAHASQTRKDGQTPYVEHLEAVASICEAHGYDDPATLSAALLHDLFEDQPAHGQALRDQMPDEVVALVHALTEAKTDGQGRPRAKTDRFTDYVARLADGSEASRRALPISCADKIHNTSSLVAAEQGGERLLSRLNTRPSEHGPHLATLRALYAPVVNASLLAAFDRSRDALLEVIARRRSLQIRLDDTSRNAARTRAQHEVTRGDHITLAHGVDPRRFEPAWVPGGEAVGEELSVLAVSEHLSPQLQVWTVHVAGGSTRAFDGGVLHLTVSRTRRARSRDANRVLEDVGGAPMRLALRGTVEWVDV